MSFLGFREALSIAVGFPAHGHPRWQFCYQHHALNYWQVVCDIRELQPSMLPGRVLITRHFRVMLVQRGVML